MKFDYHECEDFSIFKTENRMLFEMLSCAHDKKALKLQKAMDETVVETLTETEGTTKEQRRKTGWYSFSGVLPPFFSKLSPFEHRMDTFYQYLIIRDKYGCRHMLYLLNKNIFKWKEVS